jgi:hypothetical protein
MNYVKDGKVETKGHHSRAENDDDGRPDGLVGVKPIYNPVTFNQHCW